MTTSSERYRWHAEVEFRNASAMYYDWASSIADDAAILALVERLPDLKRRAPLMFAAARFAGAPLAPYTELRPWLFEHWGEVETVALARSQQTNEAGRCATLLPLLSAIEGPIALLEVGASAGACLYPDRYAYEYVTPEGEVVTVSPDLGKPDDGANAVHLRCEIDPASAIPSRMPEVVWRAGVDLNPLSYASPDDVDWLQALVWPEHDERRARLAAVASIVREDPPRIVLGDAIELLPSVAAEAPEDATLVVFHSAVLAYFELPDRERFAETVEALDATWLSNEGAGVLPWVTEQLDPALDIGPQFVLAQDRVPVALTGGHGQSYRQL